MKNLTLNGAVICLTLAVLELILFPFIIECSAITLTFYILIFVMLVFTSGFLLYEYIDEIKDAAYWRGYEHGLDHGREIKQYKNTH